MELLDIRFSFICRSTHLNADQKSPVVLRITFRGERRDVFTGLYCSRKYWNPKTNKLDLETREGLSFNKNLDIIARKANECFDELRFADAEFTIDELVDKVKGKEERPTLLIDYLKECNEEINKREGIEISRATYIKYRSILQHLQEFLQKQYRVRNIPLQRIDTRFLEKFFHYLRIDKSISNNTAIKYLKSLKTNLVAAIKMGAIKNDPFADLKLKLKQIPIQCLTQEEIDKLVSLKLPGKDLDRIRDIFLFSCFTGLAYIDLKQLNGTHIIQDQDGSYFIRKNRQKTGQESIVPLLPAAINILKKYSLTENIKDFKWHVSANQKTNLRLKTIGELGEFSKPLHMHLARHTFATTVTLSNGVPIETVSSMMVHASFTKK
jgi:site-specific recombinase XerD